MTDLRQDAVVDGRAVTATVTEVGLHVDGLDGGTRLLAWLDIDDVLEGDHRVSLVLADASTITLGQTGRTHDRFMSELRAARRAVRLPALAMATGAPAASFESRHPDSPADVHLFDKALVIEPRSGIPTCVPLSLIDEVRRDGYTIHLRCRGLAESSVRMLGARTDEFAERLDRARTALRGATAHAYEAYDSALAGCTVPDGWAVTRTASTSVWEAMHRAASAGDRAAEVAVFTELAGDRLAYGLFTDGGEHALPFLMAPVGEVVAVEAVGGEDRATFVFRTTDLTQLNAALVTIAFRREALSLPLGQLGRWAVAARTSPTVQWARSAFTARVVHDARWEQALRTAVRGS